MGFGSFLKSGLNALKGGLGNIWKRKGGITTVNLGGAANSSKAINKLKGKLSNKIASSVKKYAPALTPKKVVEPAYANTLPQKIAKYKNANVDLGAATMSGNVKYGTPKLNKSLFNKVVDSTKSTLSNIKTKATPYANKTYTAGHKLVQSTVPDIGIVKRGAQNIYGGLKSGKLKSGDLFKSSTYSSGLKRALKRTAIRSAAVGGAGYGTYSLTKKKGRSRNNIGQYQ